MYLFSTYSVLTVMFLYLDIRFVKLKRIYCRPKEFFLFLIHLIVMIYFCSFCFEKRSQMRECYLELITGVNLRKCILYVINSVKYFRKDLKIFHLGFKQMSIKEWAQLVF